MNQLPKIVESSATKLPRRYLRLLRALGWATLLAVIGNAIWELLVRPGLTKLGRALLDLVTFGSTAAKDTAYSSAALDPYPVAALLILIFLASAPLGMVLSVPMRRLGGFVRTTKRAIVVLSAFVAMSGVGLFLATCILSQAILIRRVFFADLAICAPYLTPQQEAQFRASFAAVSKQSEFQLIQTRLQAVAVANGVSLRSEGLW